MGLFSRLLGECMCPPWLTLNSKDEAGYFDPLDTPGFLGDVCQALWRPEAASYINHSGKGCMGTNIPPSCFSPTSVVATLVRLVCPRIWWAYKLCVSCLGKPWSSHCCLAGVFLGCSNLDRRCTLLRICSKLWTLSLGRCPSTLLLVPPFLGKCSRMLLGKTRRAYPL